MTGATLAILAGGEGRRMGRPKGELRVGGEPILSYLLERLQWPGPTMLVTAPGRQRPPGAERFDREVTDAVAGEGPVRGVLTALTSTPAATEALIVAPCDMPAIEGRQLRWLLNEMTRRPQADLIMLSRGGRTEPFPLALRPSVLPALREHFAGGGRSMQSLTTLPAAVVLPVPPEWSDAAWTNLNAPADAAAFRAAAGDAAAQP